MGGFEDYIGYYDWEGSPCRILRDAEDPELIRAEIYHPGKGMVPIAISRVLDGVVISEKQFKALVLALIASNKP